ncbi:hypothetical protein FQZ97_1198670 [compost metagenome]
MFSLQVDNHLVNFGRVVFPIYSEVKHHVVHQVLTGTVLLKGAPHYLCCLFQHAHRTTTGQHQLHSLIEQGGGQGKGRQRGVEYTTVPILGPNG